MVQANSQKIFSGQKPVFDGRKNLYSKDPLPVGREKVCGTGDCTCEVISGVISKVLLKVEAGHRMYGCLG